MNAKQITLALLLFSACDQAEERHELCSMGTISIPVMLIHPSEFKGKGSDDLDQEMVEALEEANDWYRDSGSCIQFDLVSVNENDSYDSSMLIADVGYLEQYVRGYESVIPLYLFDRVTGIEGEDNYGGGSAWWLDDICKRVVGFSKSSGELYAHELGHQFGAEHSGVEGNFMHPGGGVESTLEQKAVVYDLAAKYIEECVNG